MDKPIEAEIFLKKKICKNCKKTNSPNAKICVNCKKKALRERKKLKFKS